MSQAGVRLRSAPFKHIAFSVFGPSRFKNKEHTLCLACFVGTLLERRIYTLCLVCFGHHAFSRTTL